MERISKTRVLLIDSGAVTFSVFGSDEVNVSEGQFPPPLKKEKRKKKYRDWKFKYSLFHRSRFERFKFIKHCIRSTRQDDVCEIFCSRIQVVSSIMKFGLIPKHFLAKRSVLKKKGDKPIQKDIINNPIRTFLNIKRLNIKEY